MKVSIIRATRRLLSEHHSDLAAFFEGHPGGQGGNSGSEMTTTDINALIDFIKAVQQREGSTAICGTLSLAAIREAWTHLHRVMKPVPG